MIPPASDVILERMMALHPKVIDLTLDRVWRLLDRLGNPQDNLPPVIHIAGTNGKGSTQAMIRAGLEADGKTVHAYTSPHLSRFHERIRLAGELISEDALSDLLDECYARNDGAPITYFEITTCAALLAFSRVAADYTLLEVGLGGRLDATNVVDKPRLTIITPVSMDHETFLGDTLDLIAGEKAGIIKRGIPLIVGPQEDAALDVIEDRATRLSAPMLVHGQHWHVSREAGRVACQDETGLVDLPLPALTGAHQAINLGTAVVALRQLGVSHAGCEAAATDVEWPARMQRLSEGPLVDAAPHAELWLDGGHNPAAGQVVADVLAEMAARPTYMVCGMLNTKDVSGYLTPLANSVEVLVAVSIPGEANALAADELATIATEAGLRAHAADSVQEAVDWIVAREPEARILIGGSLYLAGFVLRENA